MSRWLHAVAALVALALGQGCGGAPRPDAPDPQPMVVVPAGWFWSGCTRAPDPKDIFCAQENSPRQLWLSAFEIDVYETTWLQYRQCAEAGSCPAPLERTERREGGGRTPVLASWGAAFDYCQWRGKRLPTEAEWEKAARGIRQRIYSWGDDPPDCARAHTWDCPPPRKHTEVGTHPSGVSPYGVHDLIGNAPEWVADPWTPTLHSDVPQNPEVINPSTFGRLDQRRPSDLYEHVVKGSDAPPYIAARSPIGYWEDPDDPAHSPRIAGFRCARDAPGPPPPLLDAGTAPAPDDGGAPR